ncbi:M28 family peptidase [bacterium]|nr:M28 family peptidase [bacterium]
MKNLISLLVLIFSLVPLRIQAQSTPFLRDTEIDMLANEISGDRAFEHIRWLSHWHRDSGMEGYFKAADYVLQAAKDAGLEDVSFIEQPMDEANYTAKSAELWMIEPVEIKLADIGDHAVYLADGSHDADLTAELIWIGDASKEALKDLDVKGKIVLTSGSEYAAAHHAVWNKGALGIVTFRTSEERSPMDFPDQIAWTHIPLDPPEGKSGTFAFSLPPRKGEILKSMLASTKSKDWFATGKETPGGKVVLKVKIDTEIGKKPGRTGFVEGWIRGSKYHDQQIVLTAHLQEEQGSANDDGSGCANLLELARTFNKLIREGKMQRPLRDIRFWWTDEIYSEYRYFMDHPEVPKQLLANLHQDMTGAKMSLGSRTQHLIFAPQSRMSYLDAIFENVATYVIHTNNSYLSAGRSGGLSRPHSRAIYSTRGSREGYRAEFVPYFGSSDNMTFVEGAIGVPSVAMINWDDNYIHSSDDDLWQIDQTQLKRNNFIVASMTLFLGSAENTEAAKIAAETFAQGQKRLTHDLKTAMEILSGSNLGNDSLWKDAAMLIEQGIQREIRATNSVRIFCGTDKTAMQMIDKLVLRLNARESELINDLQTFYRHTTGTKPRDLSLTAEELAASKKIPVNAVPLETYFNNRARVKFKSALHSIMKSEVYNFVDGKRSYYDIYKAVRSEALSSGTWYYGTVTLDGVTGLLDAAVETKVLILK